MWAIISKRDNRIARVFVHSTDSMPLAIFETKEEAKKFGNDIYIKFFNNFLIKELYGNINNNSRS